MKPPRVVLAAVMSAAVALAIGFPVLAQVGEGGSAADAGGLEGPYCTFGSVPVWKLDSQPGLKLFLDGAEAYRRKDYRHAVYMYKVAASYDDAAAEYDLGLMYFRGEGVPVDKPLGAAWMTLAARRGDPLYVKARDLLVTALTDAQFAQADKLWGQLQKTYDEAAVTKAKIALGDFLMNDVVGSHLGIQTGMVFNGVIGPRGGLDITPELAFGNALDDLNYRRQLGPGSPDDQASLKCPTGTVNVGPLEQVNTGSDRKPRSSARPDPADKHP